VSDPILIAQLTDTHVLAFDSTEDRHVDNNARLRGAVAMILAESPRMDAVLATGDLTNWGHPGEYDALAELLAPLRDRLLPIPGNHDDRDRLRATFPDAGWIDAAHASWVTTVEAVRIVGLDSTDPGQPGARFDDEREAWLRSVLSVAHAGPTILALHHPPFATGIGWMDRSGFGGLERFDRVVRDHPVDRVVCGHLHRPTVSTVGGVTAQVGMSTVQHVALGLGPASPVELVVDPVGYQILRVDGHSIVTHTRYTDPAAPSFTPPWA
jgi:3',5'-cyclic AMP phosphodiesterase CpdA